MEDSSHLPVLKWSAALMKVDRDTIEKMKPHPSHWPADIDKADLVTTKTLEALMKDLGTEEGEEVTQPGKLSRDDDKSSELLDDEPDVVVEYERDIAASSSSDDVTSGDIIESPMEEVNNNCVGLISDRAKFHAAMASQDIPTTAAGAATVSR